MSRLPSELEAHLQQLILEHRKLLRFVESHQAAMRIMDLKAMDVSAGQQEACRLRIAGIENKRRMLVPILAKQANLSPGQTTVSALADAYPQRRKELLALRDELRQAIGEVAARTNVAGKLAGAVLGHLNTVVRIIAGAVEQAGVYTRQGTPRVAARLGIIDAVG
ncbi:MAG TPA: flagellar export chaperone FlgN [Tepidisphaeraceae bacterium]|nr:flagellar export chaperone FlgN [Tepidisphaeraceae bacterium]